MRAEVPQPDPLQPAAETPLLVAGRLRQFMAYAKKVFGINALLDNIRDRRKEPTVPTALVARIVFFVGLLRLRSFNALEPKLAEPWMQRALGCSVVDRKLCSVDAISYALHRMDVSTARLQVVKTIRQAERNKVFREGWHAGLRMVALDGWEPFSSYNRCCDACLTREIKSKTADGEERTATQYYHRFVVAMLLDDRMDVVVDIESVQSADMRADAGEADITGHEGELTAAKRLVSRLRKTYGRWIDGVVVDALYANGPFLTVAKDEGLSVIFILKKENNEPLKEALSLLNGVPAHDIIDDPKTKELVELWDCPDIETLDSYDGKIRVVRAVVTDKDGKQGTWCIGVTGPITTRLSPKQVLGFGRGRWHIENTAFHQFVHRWNFGHVFTHSGHAIQALVWIFVLAFNLLQLFLYRVLRSYCRDRGKDVTQTISRLIDEMNDDLARLDTRIAWDTS